MSRDSSGNYQLPSGNPVTPGTTITASQFNATMNDLAAEMTGSLPRNGSASMTGPFRLADGSVTTPAFGFNSEASTGLFRPGSSMLAIVTGGSERARFAGGNLLVGTVSDGGQRLQVNGTSAFNGAMSLTGNLALTGDVNQTGTLNLAGNFNLTTGTATGITKAMVGLGNVDNTSDANKPASTAVQALIDSILAARRGTISAVPFASVPTGALACNGQAVSRTTYAALFALIGTAYGAGDGSTTFNVPDYRGVHLRGLDAGRGLDVGRTLGSYQDSANLAHNHGVNDPGHAHSIADPGHSHSVNDPGHAHGAWTDGQGAHAHNYTVGNTYLFGGAVCASNVASEARATDVQGNHGHNVGVGASGTGIWLSGSGTGIGIYGNGTSISIQSNGGSESRPRNVSVNWIIWY